MAKALVELMTEDDLEIQDATGQIAMAYAAILGITQLAKCIIKKNKKLLSLPSPPNNSIPLVLAHSLGHWELARYLYSVTPLDALLQDNGHVGAEIVSESFRAKNFGTCFQFNLLPYNKMPSFFLSLLLYPTVDVALDLIRRCPNLALAKSYSGLTPLQVCAGTRSGFLSGMHLKFWQQWIYER
ncbi:unnamed protein product [Prunus armeniaca]